MAKGYGKTALEANANKYSFVWKKSTNKYVGERRSRIGFVSEVT